MGGASDDVFAVALAGLQGPPLDATQSAVLDTDVSAIVEVYLSGSAEQKREFIEALPPSSFREFSVGFIGMPELEVVALENLAMSFKFGVPDLCAKLALACHRICVRRLADGRALAYEKGAPRCLSTCVNTLRDNGKQALALPLLEAGIAALDGIADTGELAFDRVELMISMNKAADAERALGDLDSTHPRHGELATELRRKFEAPTDIPDLRPFDERLADDRAQQLTSLVAKLGGLLPPEIATALGQRVANEPKKSPDQILSNAMSTLELMQKQLGIPTDRLDSQAAVQQRLRTAGALLHSGAQDPERLRPAVASVGAAFAYAEEHGLSDDAMDALWILAICHKRLGERGQAIAYLADLSGRVERTRRGMSPEPLRRLFSRFPNLADVQCELLAEERRYPELLEAIEGGKGRVVADILAEQRRQLADSTITCDAVKDAAATLRAHYLTYYVDDESIHAVLVTARRAIRSVTLPFERATVRAYAVNVDPSKWNKKQGAFGRIPGDLVAKFSPLVAWLGSFVRAGELNAGEHICYSADDALHLIPLQLLELDDGPIVGTFSLSRIQGAGAFVALSARSPLRPSRCITFEAPARDDPPDKAALLYGVGEWLASKLQGVRLVDGKASLAALRESALDRVVVHFAAHGRFPETGPGVDANPYTGSGVLLAADDKLPLRTYDWPAVLSPRVLLEDLTANAFEDSHVTLLACVSGLAKDGRGGDALGLEWAFVVRGAASVLTTHWNISAEDGAELVSGFYRRWLDGESRASAWQSTVNELRRTKPAVAWGAFSLCGDFR